MHECPICGQGCACDGEDLWHDDAPDDCLCGCVEEIEDELDDDDELDDAD